MAGGEGLITGGISVGNTLILKIYIHIYHVLVFVSIFLINRVT